MKTLGKHSRMWVVALAAAAGMAATGAFAQDKAMDHGDMMGHGDMMKAVDTDHDGKISATEHAAHAKAMFDKIDANHDGIVDKAEMDAGMKMMHEKMGCSDHMQHGEMHKDDDAKKQETTPAK